MKFEDAPDVKKLVEKLSLFLEMDHVVLDRVFCIRSEQVQTDATARIWELPRVFSTCLEIPPAYVIEVIAKRYDKLDAEGKEKIVLHELLHIPKTFSGALVPHKCFGKMRVNNKIVNELYGDYKRERDGIVAGTLRRLKDGEDI